MKKKIFILLPILCLILFIGYIFLDQEKLDILLSIFSFICTFTTLMIAVSLFDKYNAGSKIIDKNIEIVISYLEFLNKSKFTINAFKKNDNKQMESYAIGIMNFNDRTENNDNSILDYNTPLYYCFESYWDFSYKLNDFLNSNWMPKEIKVASEFLKLPNIMERYTLEEVSESNIITLTITPKKKNDDLIKIPANITLNMFLENNFELRKCIKKWLKSQANDIYVDID